MSIRNENESDSLWLLLDTICNAFGGMLLVALLFAIFANVEQKTTVPAALTNQIAQLSNDIVTAQASYTNLLSSVRPLEDRTQLWQQVQLLTTNSAALELTVSNLSAEVSNRLWMVAHPDATASNANLTYKLLVDELTAATNSYGGILATFQGLTNELHRLVRETGTNASRTVTVHLPNEHPSGKRAYHVILKFDQVYFERDQPQDMSTANMTGLSWTLGEFDQLVLAPVQGRGVAPDGEEVQRQLKALDRAGNYLVCWVFADSFGAFTKLKPAISSTKLDYGWIPLTMEQSVSVAADPAPPTPAQ